MVCKELRSKKKFLGPIAYIFLQSALLIGFAFSCSLITNSEGLVLTVFFWVSTFLTFVTYFIIHFKNPGYLPRDNQSFKENEENISENQKVSLKNESEFKFKALDSRNHSHQENFVYDTKNEFLEKIAQSNQNQSRKLKLQDSITNSTTNLNTKMNTGTQEKSIPELGIIKTQELYLKEEKENIFETENTKKIRHEGQNVVCEPSIIEKDENEESSSNDYEGRIDFNMKSQERSEESLGNLDQEMGNSHVKKSKANSFSCKKAIKESYGVHFYKTVETEFEADFAKENIRIENIDKELFRRRFLSKEKSINHQNQTADASCNIPLQTGDEDSSKDIRMREMNLKLEKFSFHSLIQSFTSRNNRMIFNSFLKVPMPFESPISQKELDICSISPPSSETDRERKKNDVNKNLDLDEILTDKKELPKTKFQKTLNSNNQLNLIPNSELNNEALKRIHIQIDNPGRESFLPGEGEKVPTEVFFVEKRYCTVCNIEQPFRSKHCKDCDRCVAKYDHHCPWLGNCIGEKNHFWFYWFLVFQSVEIILGQIKLYLCIFQKSDESELYWKIIILAISTIFLLMTISLFLFHSYLAITNLSTWEKLSWNKITYLDDWPKAWGSPFSKGIKENLKFFCCHKSSDLKEWEMPKRKKSVKK